MNLDERLVESLITPRTKAVVAVHYAGVPCAMDKLKMICRQHELRLIEDAAQAILTHDEGQALGTIGDMGCLSFHETKNVICGEGGALLINDPALIERAEIIWQKGTNRKAFFRGEVDKYSWVDIGSSFLPNELTAAFLFAQLEHARRINTHRRVLYEKYLQLLAPMEQEGFIQLPKTAAQAANGHIFYILCSSLETPHRAEPTPAYTRHRCSVPLRAAARFAGRAAVWPRRAPAVTTDVAQRLLRLPMFSNMTSDDVRRVASAIKRFHHPTASTGRKARPPNMKPVQFIRENHARFLHLLANVRQLVQKTAVA